MHVHVCAYMHMRMHTRMLRTPAPAHAHAHGRVQARLKMLRVNKKSTPVVDADGKFAGTLKYNAVVKAVKAGKAAQMVKAWMRREGVTVAADTPFDGVQPRLVLPRTHYVPTVYSLSTHCLLTVYSLCVQTSSGSWRARARGGCPWSRTTAYCLAS